MCRDVVLPQRLFDVVPILHDFNLLIPEDCCVSNTTRENDEALALMRKFLKADTRASTEIELDAPGVVAAAEKR